MVMVVAVLCAACSGPYAYETRAGMMVRVNRITGSADILKRDSKGQERWMPVAEGAEPVPQTSAAAVEAPREMPADAISQLEITIQFPTFDMRSYSRMADRYTSGPVTASVINRSTWDVTEIRGRLSGRIYRLQHAAIHYLQPGDALPAIVAGDAGNLVGESTPALPAGEQFEMLGVFGHPHATP